MSTDDRAAIATMRYSGDPSESEADRRNDRANMPAYDKTAAALAKKVGPKAMAIVTTAVANKAIKKAATKAGETAATSALESAATGGGNFVTKRRTDRRNRRLACDLAEQVGGSYSARTVIAGERYFVVWRGEEPIEVFPALPKHLAPLAERPELQDFQGVRLAPQAAKT